jgi:integrase
MPWDDNLAGPHLQIAAYAGTPLRVIAGPGTGKTKGAAKLGVMAFRGPEQERLLVGEILDAYLGRAEALGRKSLPQIKSHMKPIREAFGTVRCLAVTPEAIAAYVKRRKVAGYSNASINRGLEVLSAAYRLALKDGRLSHTPRIESLPEHNTCTGFFEADQFDALVGHLPEYLQDLARFAYYTGWRKGDLVKLRWDTVDLEGGVIRLRSGDTKTGKGRVLALDTTLHALIERRYQDRLTGTADAPVVSDFVFDRSGRPVGDIRKAWATACLAAGIQPETKMRAGREVVVPGRKVHDFRRTAARDMIRSGTPETVVMAVTGHTTRAMLDRYNITSERDTREAMEALSARRAGKGGEA